MRDGRLDAGLGAGDGKEGEDRKRDKVSSATGKVPSQAQGVSAASKHALQGYFRSLRYKARLGGGGGGGGRGLRRLEIVRSAHSKRVVAELAEFVAAEHAHVEELALELGECAAGVVAALAANSHSRLRLLRLGGSVPESAAVALAHALRAGTTGLREVDLRGGLLATPGVLQAMADALAENTMLTCLRMDCGDFDASESTRDKVAAAMEALVGAVERRGGLHTLGLSIPAGFWASPAAALLCAWPKRFSPPPLARLLSGASPLVTVLHLTAPYDDWRFGAAAAWRFWLGLSRGAVRRVEGARTGVVLHLHAADAAGGAVVETWESHACRAGESVHRRHTRTQWQIALDVLLLVFFPLVHMWQVVDSMHHVDFSKYTCLDWIFMAPLACFRTVGLIAGLLTLCVVGTLHSLCMRVCGMLTRLAMHAVAKLRRPKESGEKVEMQKLLCEVV
eukprot:jgi/Mesen1/5898/ME000003S06926